MWESPEKLVNRKFCLVVTLKNQTGSFFPSCSVMLSYSEQVTSEITLVQHLEHQRAMSKEDRQGTFVGCLGAGSQMASLYITSSKRVRSVRLSFHHRMEEEEVDRPVCDLGSFRG